MYGLPIRIGTLNARDTQDVLIYAINDYYDGSVGISNYAEVTVEDECMWNPDGDETFSEFYADQFQEAYENTEGGVWMLEYAWGQANCDPCTGDPPDATDMVSLGFEFADSDKGIEFFFSRLHVRYAPSEATQDLVLYQSGITSYDQVRYIQYDYYLEDRFEICGVGWAEDPGSCDEWVDTGDSGGGKGEGGSGDNTVDTQDSGDVDGTGDGSREGGDDTGSATESDASCRGCSSARAPVAGMVWLLGLVALRRRSIR
jgi:hypothetical protein